ncbi:hypothetical protein [Cellulomonas sp. Marseille-Q8402]
MRAVAVATIVLVGLMVLSGFPFALLLRRVRDGWVAAAVDAAMFGLVVLPLSVTLWTWWGTAGVVVPTLGWLAAAVVVARRGRAGLPARPRRPAVGSAVRGTLWCVVLAGAALLRLREVEFIPWVGDMGGYVNWANELVRTGTLDASWPPLYSSYLAISTALFGTAHTTAGMTAVGLVLVLALARLAHQLGVNSWVVLAVGVVVAVHTHAVWYGTFPASESLAAPFLVVWLVTVHRALSGPGRAAHVVAGGVVVLALCLLRANGPLLLVPVLVVLAAVLAVRPWRQYARTWAWVTAAFVSAAGTGYWYGITVISGYYVETQFPLFLSPEVMGRLRGLGVFDPTLANAGVLAALTTVGCGVVVALGTWVTGRDARRPTRGGHVGETVVLAAAAVSLVALLVVLAGQDGDVWRIAGRVGLWLFAAGALGVVAARWFPDRAARPLALLAVTTILLYLVFQDGRLGPVREHAFYLYWDRYLFSEVLPCLVLLGAIALHQGLTVLDAGLRTARVADRGRAVVAAPVAAAAALGVVAWAAPEVRRANHDTFMRGAYDLAAELADVALDEDAPVLWSSAGGVGVADYFFPNSWMALAKPLVFTWDVDVANLKRPQDFSPDQQVSEAQMRLAATCADSDSVTVLEVTLGAPALDERLADSDLELAHLRTVRGGWRILSQFEEPTDWRTIEFNVEAWRVGVPEHLRVSPAICDPERWREGAGTVRTQVQ